MIVTEYCRVLLASAPLATVVAVVERGKAAAQFAVAPCAPDELVTLAAEQVTVTAETGTVEQLVNVVAAAWTFRVQVLPPPDPLAPHEAIAVELPATTGSVPGLVALKVIVAGLTVSVKLAPASGETSSMARSLPTGTTVGFTAAAASNAMVSQPVIVLGGGDGERRGGRVGSGGVYRIVGEGPRCRSRIPGFG